MGRGRVALSLKGASALVALIASTSHADVATPVRPAQIEGGFEVEPCAWPSVAYLARGPDVCTGVYIGGRVVLTASHCLSTHYVTDLPCEDDTDCPTADQFGNPLELSCTAGGDTNCCCDSTESLIVNRPPVVLFGERYPNFDGHPRRTVPVQYCRKRSLADSQFDTLNDFGYCILAEEPEIQPIPMIMPCEVEQFLTAGTEVVAVGFGIEDTNAIPEPHGVKHYLLSTLNSDVTNTITLSEWIGASPGATLHGGDSGGPLFARLPDGTWRLIGVAVRSPAFYEEVWRHVEWMFEDPNVAAERGKILPCHKPDGEWAPTASCGQFPLTPDAPAGDWTRGAFACHHPDVSGPSATCGAPFMPPDLAAVPAAPPTKPPDGPPETRGPRDDQGLGMAVLGPLLVGGFGAGLWASYRRRKHHA